MPGEDMPVDLVERGIGPPADEPAPVRRVRCVERRGPGGEIIGQRHRPSRLRIPAAPATGVLITRQPSTRLTAIGREPVDRPRRDVTMKRAGIGQHGRAHRLPIRTRANRVTARNRRRKRPLCLRHPRLALLRFYLQRAVSLNHGQMANGCVGPGRQISRTMLRWALFCGTSAVSQHYPNKSFSCRGWTGAALRSRQCRRG